MSGYFLALCATAALCAGFLVHTILRYQFGIAIIWAVLASVMFLLIALEVLLCVLTH